MNRFGIFYRSLIALPLLCTLAYGDVQRSVEWQRHGRCSREGLLR